MGILSWMKHRRDDIKEAREQTRINRGRLTQSVVELDQHRHVLEEMVKRSLELMERKNR
jgi:hypothetical protein